MDLNRLLKTYCAYHYGVKILLSPGVKSAHDAYSFYPVPKYKSGQSFLFLTDQTAKLEMGIAGVKP